jgi:hypothetical protein
MERVRKFRQQRSNAKRRGIGWELTFKQWREIWNDSDLYHLRDRRGFVMHRNSDESPYAVGNVEIISATEFITWGTATIAIRSGRCCDERCANSQ